MKAIQSKNYLSLSH